MSALVKIELTSRDTVLEDLLTLMIYYRDYSSQLRQTAFCLRYKLKLRKKLSIEYHE